MKWTLGMIWMKWKMGMAWMKLTVLAEFVAPNVGHGRLALSREGRRRSRKELWRLLGEAELHRK
ncbi:MAG TPA: hypothetical protein PKD26_10045 [Pyrinomonadaceae bacterium]|nr:hypothetical protein [Pyrinomonadaceae bacterium]